MTIAELQRWFDDGAPFDEGVQLFLHFCPNNALNGLFSANPKETTFLARKLREALEKRLKKEVKPAPTFSPKSNKPSQQQPTVSPAPVIHTAGTKIDYPKELQHLVAEKKKLYGIASEVRMRMFFEKDQKTRAALYDRLHDIMVNNIDAIWFELDYWNQTGEILSQEKKNLGLPELIKRRNNVRTYVSKYQGVAGQEKKYDKYNLELISLNHLYEHAISK